MEEIQEKPIYKNKKQFDWKERAKIFNANIDKLNNYVQELYNKVKTKDAFDKNIKRILNKLKYDYVIHEKVKSSKNNEVVFIESQFFFKQDSLKRAFTTKGKFQNWKWIEN